MNLISEEERQNQSSLLQEMLSVLAREKQDPSASSLSL
jgi:hypothetical protein